MKNTIHQMLNAGIHFGHAKHQWNPKMLPYIYKEKNGTHIIDIIQTWFYLNKVKQFLETSASQGKKILFVGTNRQTAHLIQQAASDSNMFFVNRRWLGGLLTNWTTLQQSIQKLNHLQNIHNLSISSKKEKVKLEKKRQRLEKYMGGLKNMHQLPDIVLIVGQQREMNAVRECHKMGLRTITILDTNCNPNLADLFIPANDDSISSVKFILDELADAIRKGQKGFKNP